MIQNKTNTSSGSFGKLSVRLEENIETAKAIFPIGKSFDLITRELYLGQTRAFFLGINGMCKAEILQRLFSDLQNPLYTEDRQIDDLRQFASAKIGYAQLSFTDDWDEAARNLLSDYMLSCSWTASPRLSYWTRAPIRCGESTSRTRSG